MKQSISSKGRKIEMTSAAKVNKWNAILKVRWDANQIPHDKLMAAIALAGTHIGIGKWRPGRFPGGPYGTFKIKDDEK